MFNYIHESIINNAANIVKSSDNTRVCIKRVGEYVLANIEGKIMKTVGNKGVPGSASFVKPEVAMPNSCSASSRIALYLFLIALIKSSFSSSDNSELFLIASISSSICDT